MFLPSPDRLSSSLRSCESVDTGNCSMSLIKLVRMVKLGKFPSGNKSNHARRTLKSPWRKNASCNSTIFNLRSTSGKSFNFFTAGFPAAYARASSSTAISILDKKSNTSILAVSSLFFLRFPFPPGANNFSNSSSLSSASLAYPTFPSSSSDIFAHLSLSATPSSSMNASSSAVRGATYSSFCMASKSTPPSSRPRLLPSRPPFPRSFSFRPRCFFAFNRRSAASSSSSSSSSSATRPRRRRLC